MIIYHQINSDELDTILQQGLKCVSRGEKGDNKDIIKTDRFLDTLRPDAIQKAGLSRDNNLYGYMSIDGSVIDIRDGKIISIDRFARNSKFTTLRLTVDPERCYVSDLNLYDTVKERLKNDAPSRHLIALGTTYWNTITKLSECDTPPRRPEVMVTYDITPENITVVR